MRRKGFKMFLIGIVILALFGALVLVLWNLIVPAVFDLPVINFWQATGLFLLGRIFFGGFGFGKRFGHPGMHHAHNNPMHEKWMKMTPEERREFINKRRRFGGGPFGGNGFFDRDCCDRNPKEDAENKDE